MCVCVYHIFNYILIYVVRKVNAFKVVALLKLGAKPDTVTPEDEPVFMMIMRKVREGEKRERELFWRFFFVP
jgi:hypothetical protein